MKKRLLLLALSLMIAGLAAGQSKSPQQLPPPVGCSAGVRFFPSGIFGESEIMTKWYSRYFCAMGERPLDDLVSPSFPQVYRVIVIWPYHRPVVVRLSIRTDGTAKLVAKIGQTYRDPQTLVVNRITEISRSDADEFLKLLDGAEFWSALPEAPLDLHHVLMGDTSWMLEGCLEDGKYHAAHRGASRLGALKQPETFLVADLAKIDIKSLPIDFYMLNETSRRKTR